MRNFFVSSFERVIGIIVVLMGVGIIAAAFASLSQAQGGLLSFAAILLFGFIYLVLIAGFIYL